MDPVADDTTLIASTLNELIQASKASEHGFECASRLVEDLNLRHLFESYARQRAEFAMELERAVYRLSSGALENVAAGAAGQRNWASVTLALDGKDDCAIITNWERQENQTATDFEQAVASGLPEHLLVMVERQLGQIKEALLQVRSLERAHSRIQ
jgi:uncharacterized protein (TIGR02284 family)